VTNEPTCPTCNLPYGLMPGCVSPDAERFFPYGEEPDGPPPDEQPCYDCAAHPGALHHPGCAGAYCRETGLQGCKRLMGRGLADRKKAAGPKSLWPVFCTEKMKRWRAVHEWIKIRSASWELCSPAFSEAPFPPLGRSTVGFPTVLRSARITFVGRNDAGS